MIQRLRTQMRLIMGIIVVAFLLSTFLMYESGGSRRRRPSPSEDGRLEDYVVAEVNGQDLLRSMLDRRVALYIEQTGSREIASGDWPYIYQAALNQYAVELQLNKEVKNSGISISNAEAEQAVKDYADQAFPTREAFYQSLERSGKKLADYQKDVAAQMAIQKLIQSVIEGITVSEDETVEFYDSTKDFLFKQPAGTMVSLADFTSRDAAEKVRALLVSGTEWAAATSGDVTASADVIRITPEPVFVPDSVFDGRLAPMKTLAIGEISPVFEAASDDYAVGIKNEVVAEKVTPYNEVSADLRLMLQQRKEREAVDNFSQRLLSESRIVIHDNSLFPAAPVVLPVSENTQSGDVASGDVSKDSSVAPTSADSPLSADTAVVSGD
ncbi:MAG: SurA N-terminal domain-containing protein [Synergistaceae bacterium]|nr:SurA N-terminal domain-containing protein [Synergistaceae bacterium]